MAKKVVKIMLSMGLVLVLLSSSVLAVTGKVTGNTVRIREKASSNSAEISAATKGEVVEVNTGTRTRKETGTRNDRT